MDSAFWDLEKQVHLLELGHPHGNLANVIAMGNILCKVIAKNTDNALLETFKDVTYDALVKVKKFLETDAQTRSIHDRLFTKYLRFSKSARFFDFARIFELFIEGITYFKHQPNNANKLVYHRLASCGDGTQAFRNTFNRCTNITKNRRQVKARIETCYIERLIYAEIFKKQTLVFPKTMTNTEHDHKQDKGHENWLEQTHEDFKTCFPKTNIRVQVSEYLGKWPTKCTIIREKNGKISKEEYVKTVYNREVKTYGRPVDCKLFTGIQTKYKVQSFEKEDRWV